MLEDINYRPLEHTSSLYCVDVFIPVCVYTV